jgi:DNA-binding NarL/FixJ family response regulator
LRWLFVQPQAYQRILRAVFAQGLSALLETYAEIEVAGEAGRGAEGVDLATRLPPDLLLMDLVMPGMGDE